VHEAGALVVGGHSIIDEELKFGLSVTGRAHPKRILSNANASPGDRLVLTKALGTGLLATAAKKNDLGTSETAALYASMCKLNANASRAALAVGARCATDVTGFGLLGHASHIAAASNVTIVIHTAKVPALPGAREAWQRGIRTGGAERNASYLESRVDWGTSADVDRALLIDPQTSGGMLVAISASRVGEYLSLVPEGVEVGEVIARGTSGLVLA
jgi:selenide,water dikinase